MDASTIAVEHSGIAGMESASPSADPTVLSPCQQVNGKLPTCSQPLLLQSALARFRREARWHTCDTGRYRCKYAVWGDGPPLVFVPGLCDDPWSFVLPMARLSERFRCVAYTMPVGNGDGACLDRYRHLDLVSDLFALLDHAGLQQASLMGVSFGSTVALAAMYAQPERISRGILQNGFARRPLAWTEALVASMARWWPGSLDHLPLRRVLFKEALEPSFDRRESDVWRYYMDHDGTQSIAAVAHRAWLLHHVDLRAILTTIRQPILVIRGDRDPLVNRACAQELLAGLPNATQAEIEACGHLPHFTHPEVLSEVVQRFLQ
jgi:pimeloyl-ACP methyl ester carboxylesterase